MYQKEMENVEVYFICDQVENMELIETYYDEELKVHNWYFNAFLAYKYWQKNFKELKSIGKLAKMLLTVASSKYILYALAEKIYQNEKEYLTLIKDLEKIERVLQKFIKKNKFIANLS